jgi:hypothetical protein
MGAKALLAVTVVAAPLVVLPFLHLGIKAIWIPFYPCGSRTIHESSSYEFKKPQSATSEETAAFGIALGNGDRLPSGFEVSHHEHELARTTGVVDWFGRHEVEVTVTAPEDDLRSTRLYIDDDLVSEATPENGDLTHSSGEAKAVMRFFLPWLAPYTVRLVRVDGQGHELDSSVTIGRSAPARK